MPSVLKDTTRKEIFSLANFSLANAQKYLKKFHASEEYKNLITTDNAELTDEDMICLALSRRSQDTAKIDVKRLGEAICHFYQKNFSEQLTLEEFFNRC